MCALTLEQSKYLLDFEGFSEGDILFLEKYQNDMRLLEDNPELSKYWDSRRRIIEACCFIVDMVYMGYSGDIDVQACVKKGVDAWVDNFCGDWWKEDEGSTRLMDKSNSCDDRLWFETYSYGLFLALLAERWEDIDRVSQWIDWDMGLSYMGDTKSDYDFAMIYYKLAEQLRSTDMPGIEKLEKLAKKFAKGPLLLYQALMAAAEGNQDEFDDFFTKALKHEARTKPPSSHFARVRPYFSVVAMTARRLGMTLPELEPKLDARLILPEKLGLK
ncbi:MAG: hypothetical protein CMJ46_11555 [Planctomyces sp.]|nr:hypothetical protein [Planctomyces sp.]